MVQMHIIIIEKVGEYMSNKHLEYTFDNFVVGECNQKAYELVSAAVELPAIRQFPICIYGKTGLGKSHLLQAAAGFVLEQNPQARLTYTTMENYCSDVIDMLKGHAAATFKFDYDFVDILIIDDIQFLEGKPTFQEMFLKTFGYLQGRNKRVILACNKDVVKLNIDDEHLMDKLKECLIAEITDTDYEMRLEILRNRADRLGLTVETSSELEEILSMIAKYVQDDTGKLVGVLNRIVSMAKVLKSEIDMELAEKILLEL